MLEYSLLVWHKLVNKNISTLCKFQHMFIYFKIINISCSIEFFLNFIIIYIYSLSNRLPAILSSIAHQGRKSNTVTFGNSAKQFSIASSIMQNRRAEKQVAVNTKRTTTAQPIQAHSMAHLPTPGCPCWDCIHAAH